MKGKNSGITLIALIITIIVMLILVAVTISMAVNGGLFGYAGNAAKETEVAKQAEQDLLNLESGLSADDLAEQFTTVDTETLGAHYQDSWIGRTIDFKSEKNNVNDWIILGKETHGRKNDVIITTKYSVSSKSIDDNMAEWVKLETTLNNACSNYVGTIGTLGTKEAVIKGVRSIKREDINNALGFTPPEEIKEYLFRAGENDYEHQQVNYWFPNENEQNPDWVEATGSNTWSHASDGYSYYFNNNDNIWEYSSNNYTTSIELTSNNLKKPENITYAGGGYESIFWVATKVICIDGNGMQLFGTHFSSYGLSSNSLFASSDENSKWSLNEAPWVYSLRPVIVLSSEIPWEDVEGLIGGYATYN